MNECDGLLTEQITGSVTEWLHEYMTGSMNEIKDLHKEQNTTQNNETTDID